MGAPRRYPRKDHGCIVKRCPFDHHRSGYCVSHYFQWRRARGLSLPTTPRMAKREVTPIMLEKIGRGLYGESWYAPLAKCLGVSENTVRRWHLDWSLIPFDAYPRLSRMIARLGDALLRGDAAALWPTSPPAPISERDK